MAQIGAPREPCIRPMQLGVERVIAVVQSGRVRRKTENENHTTLKHRGYHLEHNFGHWRQFLASFWLSLNLSAFLLHTALDLTEPRVKQLRVALGPRMTVFNDLRALTRYFHFQSWEHLLDFMLLTWNCNPCPDCLPLFQIANRCGRPLPLAGQSRFR